MSTPVFERTPAAARSFTSDNRTENATFRQKVNIGYFMGIRSEAAQMGVGTRLARREGAKAYGKMSIRLNKRGAVEAPMK